MLLKYKVFCFGIIVSFFLGACSQSDIEDINITQGVETRGILPHSSGEGDASIQLQANILYSKIIKGIEVKDIGSQSAVQLPDYYGGAYTDEGGKLFILIKGDLAKGKEQVQSIVGRQEIIEFKECSFSYQQLTNVINEITSNLSRLPLDLKKDVYSYSVEDKENYVSVCIKNINEQKIGLFKEIVSNHEAIRFSNCSDLRINSVLSPKSIIYHRFIRSGSVVENSSVLYSQDKYSGSWAFRARDVNDTTVCGMVTASHVLYTDSAFINGIPFGVAEARYMTSSIDAAFVPYIQYNMFNDFVLTNYLVQENENNQIFYSPEEVLSLETYSPIVGTIVNKRGVATFRTTGVVQSTNFNLTYETHNGSMHTFNHLIRASFLSDPGDSGGIVYTYFSNTETRYTTGIVSLKVYDEFGMDAGSAYCKADSVLIQMGLERY